MLIALDDHDALYSIGGFGFKAWKIWTRAGNNSWWLDDNNLGTYLAM